MTGDVTRRVAVYCGSSSGTDPAYLNAATRLGAELALRRLGLVYGGGRVGLMGAVADAALTGGGDVHGVITTALERAEIAHPHLTTLEVVESMHQRKARMAELADGFVVLPGGFGTLDELFEVLTWTQLGIHRKPVVLVNVLGYFDPLFAFANQAATAGFMKPVHAELLRAGADVGSALALLAEPLHDVEPKWIR